MGLGKKVTWRRCWVNWKSILSVYSVMLSCNEEVQKKTFDIYFFDNGVLEELSLRELFLFLLYILGLSHFAVPQ